MTTRLAGFVAVMCVVIVMSPFGAVADFVQVTVMATGFDRFAGSHVFPNPSVAGALFRIPQVWAEPCVALMSFEMLCGRTSLTGRLSRFWPIPFELKFWFQRFDWSDEPLKLCAPSASRW